MKARSNVKWVVPVCPDCVRQLVKPPYTLSFAMKRLRYQAAKEKLLRWAIFGNLDW